MSEDRRRAAVTQRVGRGSGWGLKSGWAGARSKRKRADWAGVCYPRQAGTESANWKEAVSARQEGAGAPWTEAFVHRGLRPTLAEKAPAGGVNTMGSCSGRCTLLALCALQLVSPGVLLGSPDPHQPREAPGIILDLADFPG